jgi:hypothetical protein
MNNRIVYAGFYDGICVYVGEGKPDRYKHLTSGVSHVYEANLFHFKGKKLDIQILETSLTKEMSLALEAEYIISLLPIWNRKPFQEARDFKRKVNIIVSKVFPKGSWKSKGNQTQVETIMYLMSKLDHNWETLVLRGQLEGFTGKSSVLSRTVAGVCHSDILKVFDIKREGSNYKVKLLEDWLNE